jgi:hypothetical protein
MSAENTTAAAQPYLDELPGPTEDTPPESEIRALLSRSVRRLHLLRGLLLYKSYSRLARPGDPPSSFGLILS